MWTYNPLDKPVDTSPKTYNPLESSTSKIEHWSTSFEDLIKKYEESGDIVLEQYAFRLKKIKLPKWTEKQVSQIVSKLSKENNYGVIRWYITRLEEIQATKNAAGKEITDEAKGAETEVQSEIRWWDNFDIENPLASTLAYFRPSEDLKKIQAISVDGQVESIEQFITRIERLKNTVSSLDAFKRLSSEDQKEFLAYLDTLSATFQKQNNKSISFINKKFDTLAQQIDKQWDGVVTLDLWKDTGKIPFPSKEEAYTFIEAAKLEAESEIQGFERNVAESVGWFLTTWLYHFINIAWKPYDFSFSFPWSEYKQNIGLKNALWDEYLENIETEASWPEWTWDWMTALITLMATVNYTETLYRRIIKDNLARIAHTLPNTVGKRFYYVNFDKKALSFQSDQLSQAEQEEINNRIAAYRNLEEHGKWLSWKEKIAFEKELRNVLGTMDWKSNTYWLKVRALRHNKYMWTGGRLYYAFRYGIFGSAARKERNIVTTNGEKTRKALLDKESLGWAFENPRFENSDDGKIQRVSHDGHSKNIEYLKNHILSRSDLSESEKKSRIKRVDDFLNGLETEPRGGKFIKAELTAIVKEWQLGVEDVKARLEKRYPFLESIIDDGSKKPMHQQWWDIKSAIAKAYGENTPFTSYTRGHALAFRFLSLVESGQWNGNEAQLNKIFEMIDSGKFEISHIYKYSFINPLRWLDTATGLFWRYWIESPELSRMSQISEGYSSKTLKEITDIWKDFDDNTKKLIKVIENGIDIDGKRYSPAQALENHIKYNIPDEEESRLKPIFNDFTQLIKDKKILLTQTELFQEFERLKNGFMPSPVLLDKLNELRNKELEKVWKNTEVERKSIIEKLQFLEFNLKERADISTDARRMLLSNIKFLMEQIMKWDEDGVNKALDWLPSLSKYAWQETIHSVTRRIKRVLDIRISLTKSREWEKTWAYTTQYDKFIEKAEKWTLNLTEKQFLDIKKWTLTFDPAWDYIASKFRESDGERFVKLMSDFQDLHKYDLRRSLSISESASIPEVEKAIQERYKAEIELAKLYDYMDGKKSTIWYDISLFARLAQKNDFTRGQTKFILDELFINRKTFSSVNTDSIIRTTVDHASEFDGREKLKSAIRWLFSSLDEVDQKRALDYMRDSSHISSRDTLPTEVQDELRVYEEKLNWWVKNIETVKTQQAELNRILSEIDEANSKKELQELKKEFNDYIKEQGINRESDDFKWIISDFQDQYNVHKDFISLLDTRKSSSTGTETPKTGEKSLEIKEFKDYKALRSYLDEIYPSIYLSWSREALEKYNREISNIASNREILNARLTAPSTKEVYKNMFSEIDIYSLREVWKLSDIKIRLAKIDSSFAGVNKYSDLWVKIRELVGANPNLKTRFQAALKR